MSDWIPVSERLPNDKIEHFYGGPEGSWGCSVLYRIHDYSYGIAYFDAYDKKFWKAGKVINIEYWQYVDPMLNRPEPPSK